MLTGTQGVEEESKDDGPPPGLHRINNMNQIPQSLGSAGMNNPAMMLQQQEMQKAYQQMIVQNPNLAA
jgi:hypothetical protein